MATQAGHPPAITTSRLGIRATQEAVTPKKVPGVKICALFGFALLAFQSDVLIKWVTGPNFHRVPSGPNQPSDAIKIAASIVTYAGFPAMLWCVYNWVVKPWRRE